MNPNQKIPKNPLKFSCETCDYNTSNKKDFIKHEQTIKHKSYQNPNQKSQKIPKNIFQCECGKNYKHKSTLSSHKKKCVYVSTVEKTQQSIDVIIKENMDFKNMIIDVVKNNSDLIHHNQDFQKQMFEMMKTNNVHNTIHNNSHNKTFNLQFFLNEQCKDAMNLMDFVDSFKLQFADLEQVGEIGYIEGISNIIMKKLNEMDVHKRPIHCSDAKREIMYVKDNNVWEKENATCDKLRKAIKYISKKNSDLIPAWNVSNPLANNFASRVNDQYLSIIQQAMGGSGEVIDSENKIIRKLAKAVLIEKL
jgi:hypothetical protein